MKPLVRNASALANTTPCGHPLVDVAALRGRRAERAVAVRSLRRALLDVGYFYAARADDLLPASYIASIYAYSRRVHALPVEVKRRFAQRGGTGAYSGLDIEQPEQVAIA